MYQYQTNNKTVLAEPLKQAEETHLSPSEAVKAVFTTPFEVKEAPQWTNIQQTASALKNSKPSCKQTTSNTKVPSIRLSAKTAAKRVFTTPFEVKEQAHWNKIQLAASSAARQETLRSKQPKKQTQSAQQGGFLRQVFASPFETKQPTNWTNVHSAAAVVAASA